jgi:hypothetical protein
MATGFIQRFKGKIAAIKIVMVANGLIFESALDTLTATGANQAGALPLTNQTNRITTVAAGTGVSLPPAVAGLELTIINHGANPLQVYGVGTDTIDDVAAAAGVTQMQGSVCLYWCSSAGLWYTEGLGTGYAGSLQTFSYTDAITAFAGGGQGSAVLLKTMINRVTIVGSAGDSVKLPVAVGGLNITVVNAAAANSLNVFPSSGDQINALGANAAFALAANKTAEFFSTVALQWHSVLTA